MEPKPAEGMLLAASKRPEAEVSLTSHSYRGTTIRDCSLWRERKFPSVSLCGEEDDAQVSMECCGNLFG